MPTLRWLTRDEDVRAAERVPYRLLEEDLALGYGDPDAGNMLIQGDNLDALKALLPYYAGQVKCIYIDPPYNTGSAFEHYDDNLEHSRWLAMMWPRLELLRELLAEDGSIWVSINDREGHYLKVIMDEVFGRKQFVANAIWEKRYSPAGDAIGLSENHDHILLYSRNADKWRSNDLPRDEKSNAGYKNPDNDPRGRWMSDNYTCNKSDKERPNLYYPITNPNTGEEIWPKRTAVWRYMRETHEKHVRENLMWWGAKGTNSTPRFKRMLELKGRRPDTVWKWGDVGHNQDAKREQLAFFADAPFSTPKPERLLERVVKIATNPGDLVLDSFLGSGTTAAVAQKMGRRYIGIEMGDHAVTHCAPRLQKVIDGEQGGISEAHHWKGGGGFRFYRLGPAVFDEDGRLQPDIRFPVLAAHVWFAETGAPMHANTKPSTFLGSRDGHGYALLYNGILGDKSVNGGNVLTRKTLAIIRKAAGDFDGPITIYGERTALSDATLKAERLTFKQTPYDVRARA